MQSKNAMGNLKNRYISVLKKCNLMNVFGSLALVTLFTSSFSLANVCMPQSAHAISVDTDIVSIEEVQSSTSYYNTFTGLDGKNYGVFFEDSQSLFSRASDLTELILRSGNAVGSGTGWQIVRDTTSSALPYYPNFTVDGVNFTVTQADGSDLVLTSPSVTLSGNISNDFYLKSEAGIYFDSSAGHVTTIDSNFIGNTGGDGAGIDVDNGSIGLVTSNFIANTVYDTGSSDGSGGAIRVEGSSVSINTVESNFIGNSAERNGGAISIVWGTIDTINSNFIGNSSSADEESYGGGAIQNAGTIGTISSNFIANNAGKGVGGAILTDANLNFVADNNIHIFTGNTDKNGYNAIYVDRVNFGSTPDEVSLVFNMQGTGGFIINDSIRGDYSRVNGSEIVIDPNVTGVYGFTITGENAANNIFYFNNEATKVKDFSLTNANLSLGSVTQSGTTSHGTISAESATFAGNSILTLNADSYTTNAAIQGSGADNTLTVEAGAQLQIANGAVGDIIKVADGFTNSSSSIATGAWDGDNLKSTSSLQLAKVTDFTPTDGTYSVEITELAPSSSGVDTLLKEYPDMQEETAKLLVEFSQVSQGSNSSDTFDKLFSRIFDSADPYNLGTSNPWLATLTAENLLQLGIVTGTASSSFTINDITFGNLYTRLNAFPSDDSTSIVYLDDVRNAQAGISAGSEQNAIKNGLAVWATPFYNNTQTSGFDMGAFENGADSNLAGLSFGADYTFQNQYRLGLALNGGGGSSESNGDFNKTTNDFDFIGASLYGAMYLNNVTLSADMGYTFVNHSVEHSLPTSLGYSKADADMDNNVFTIGTEVSYLYKTQAFDITPYLGLRYTNVHTSAYDVKVNDSTVVHTESDSQDIFSIPLGVKLSKEFTTANNWEITPSVDLGMTYSFGDLEATSTSSIPTIVGNATYNVENIDKFAFSGGIGLEMAKDNLSFALDYDLQTSRHETSHGVQATFRYEF